MQAATATEIEGLLDVVVREFEKDAVPASSLSGWMRLRSGGVSPQEIARLSEEFLRQRRTAANKILGQDGYADPPASLILLPTAETVALAWTKTEPPCVVVSAGLLEVLRLECCASLLYSYFTRLMSNQAAIDLLGPKAESVKNNGELLFQFLHGCSVLYFFEPGYLPNLDQLLSARVRQKVTITLEATLIFLLLHELGHVVFRRVVAHDENWRPGVWEFAVPEELDSRKSEELFADAYALDKVPAEFRLHLVHGATFFFNIHNYVELLSGENPREHPLSVNRLAALATAVNASPPSERTGQSAVARAIDVARSGWSTSGDDAREARGPRLNHLRKWLAKVKETDWTATIIALNLVAEED